MHKKNHKTKIHVSISNVFNEAIKTINCIISHLLGTGLFNNVWWLSQGIAFVPLFELLAAFGMFFHATSFLLWLFRVAYLTDISQKWRKWVCPVVNNKIQVFKQKSEFGKMYIYYNEFDSLPTNTFLTPPFTSLLMIFSPLYPKTLLLSLVHVVSCYRSLEFQVSLDSTYVRY